jgi:hypothetical protein
VPFALKTDTVKHMAKFGSRPGVPEIALSYAFPDSQHLVLRGRLGADSVEMTLRRRAESSYLLVNRGFHWINETPFFR